MKRVVFLDFDNVLNDDDTHKRDWIKPGPGLFVEGHVGLDRDKVERLNQLVTPDTRFVFSTSWRKFYTDEQLLKILQDRGFKGQIHEKSPRTPLRFSYTTRGSQIREWLEDADDLGYLPESFVVLDDMPTDYIELGRHVQTESEDGLTEEKVGRAIGILAIPALLSEYNFPKEESED